MKTRYKALAGAAALAAVGAVASISSFLSRHDHDEILAVPSYIHRPAAYNLTAPEPIAPLEARIGVRPASSEYPTTSENTLINQKPKLLEQYPGLFNEDTMASEFERIIAAGQFEDLFAYFTNLASKESLARGFQLTNANTRTWDMPWQNMNFADGSRLTAQTDNPEKSTLSFYTRQLDANGKSQEYTINMNVIRDGNSPSGNPDELSFIMITATCGYDRTGRADIVFDQESKEWKMYLRPSRDPIKTISSAGLQGIVSSLSDLDLRWQEK